MILTIDHGFNASTFTARVVTSTGADLAAAIVAAIGALSGPLHGGAPSRALDMLDAIATADRAEAYLRAALENGERIMGFGHRVYKTDDPRSLLLRSVTEQLGGPLVEFSQQWNARRSTCWPNSSRAVSSTPTSSSTPAWSCTPVASRARCSRRPSPPGAHRVVHHVMEQASHNVSSGRRRATWGHPRHSRSRRPEAAGGRPRPS